MGSDKTESGSGAFAVAIHFRAEFQLPSGDLMELPCAQLGDHITPITDGNLANPESPSSTSDTEITGGVRFEEVEDVLLEHIPMLSMAYRESKNNLPTGDYPDAMETMGDRIRLLRQSKGLTQEQLGDRLGVSKVAVSQWETGGTSNVRLKTFLALVEELGTTPHYLIFGPDNRSHAQKRRTGP
jgi:DNA-binding XRE family transcriptional regulator